MMKHWNVKFSNSLWTGDNTGTKIWIKHLYRSVYCTLSSNQTSDQSAIQPFSPVSVYLDKSFWGCALLAGFQPPEWPDPGQCSLLPQCFLLFCFLNELSIFLKPQPALLRQRMFLPDWLIAWFWFTLHLLVPPLALILKYYLKCTSLDWLNNCKWNFTEFLLIKLPNFY